MSGEIRLALVTVLYRSDAVLPDFFRSLSLQTFRHFTLYVVDNSPQSTTEHMLQECLAQFPVPRYRYIDSGGNVGVAAGNNLGISAALEDGATHILLLNNDIVFEQPDLFDLMLAASSEYALVTPKIYYHDTGLLWLAGGHMDHFRALGVHEGMGKADGPAYQQARLISYAPTCFLLVRREVFERCGIMDEAYFCYYDDTDFVCRAQQAGFRMGYEPSGSLYHKVSSSSGGDDSLFYIYYSHRNKIYFIRKHYRSFRKGWLLFYTFISRIAFWFSYGAEGRKKMIQGLKDGFRLPSS